MEEQSLHKAGTDPRCSSDPMGCVAPPLGLQPKTSRSERRPTSPRPRAAGAAQKERADGPVWARNVQHG
eukprot:1009804-Rhodomonas_salina.10